MGNVRPRFSHAFTFLTPIFGLLMGMTSAIVFGGVGDALSLLEPASSP